MAICNALTAGLAKSCSTNTGGLNKFYVTDFENVTAYTIAAGTGGDWITGITLGAGDFYEFQTNKNVCNFTEKATIDLQKGTTFFDQKVSLVLSRRETIKRNAIEELTAGQKPLLIICLDSNGLYWLSGKIEGSFVSNVDGGTGTAKADSNGYTIEFSAMEPEQMYQIDPSIISGIVSI